MKEIQINYSIHPVKKNGDIVWTATYPPQNYSNYYENDGRYNGEDASAHKLELEDRHPDLAFVVIEETTTYALWEK